MYDAEEVFDPFPDPFVDPFPDPFVVPLVVPFPLVPLPPPVEVCVYW